MQLSTRWQQFRRGATRASEGLAGKETCTLLCCAAISVLDSCCIPEKPPIVVSLCCRPLQHDAHLQCRWPYIERARPCLDSGPILVRLSARRYAASARFWRIPVSPRRSELWHPCLLKQRRDACLRLYTRRHRTRCPLRSRQRFATRLRPVKTPGRRATPSIQAVTFSPTRKATPVPRMPKRDWPLWTPGFSSPEGMGVPVSLLSAEGVPYRYRLESESVKGKPHCRFAVERTGGRPVCLKFFVGRRQAYRNAVSLHRALQAQRKHVCRCVRQNVAVIDIHLHCAACSRPWTTPRDFRRVSSSSEDAIRCPIEWRAVRWRTSNGEPCCTRYVACIPRTAPSECRLGVGSVGMRSRRRRCSRSGGSGPSHVVYDGLLLEARQSEYGVSRPHMYRAADWKPIRAARSYAIRRRRNARATGNVRRHVVLRRPRFRSPHLYVVAVDSAYALDAAVSRFIRGRLGRHPGVR